MKKFILPAFALITLFAISPSHASEDVHCDVPENEWLSKEEAAKKVESEGWSVRKVKVEDGCYEVYAFKNNERAEIFVNPKTLEIVRIKKDD